MTLLHYYTDTKTNEIPHAWEFVLIHFFVPIKSRGEATFIFLLPQKPSHPPTDVLRGSTYLINPLQSLETQQ